MFRTIDTIGIVRPPIVETQTITFTPVNLADVYVPSILNDDYNAQQNINRYLYYRILDYWMKKSKMESIRQYLKVDANGAVKVVNNEDEYNKNDASKDSKKDMEIKSEYLKENFYSKEDMRKILMKMMEETNYPWTQLVSDEGEKGVVHYVKKYFSKKLAK